MIEQGPYLVVFFHWSVIPGDEKTVRLRYTLPWTIDSEQSDPIYSFSIQKQMGMPDTPVSKTISSKGQFRDINKEFLLTKDPRSFQFPLIY
ncbi:MAG: hypothetical protein U9Q15_00140 [Patescibacteria group bacterium]|nr:hypothetical protein [Patescibacteria group bacterium]